VNVLLLTNLFPTPADPTRGVFTQQLARELGRRCRLSVVCPLPWFPPLPDVGPFRRWTPFSRVPSHYWMDGQLVRSPKYPLFPRLSESVHAELMFPTLFQAVRRLHERAPLDVINAKWLYPDGVAAVRVGARLGVPVVLSASGCDVNLFLRQPEKREKILRALRTADAVTTVSRAMKERLVSEGLDAGRLVAIPNGVDGELFHPRDRARCRRELGLRDAGRIVLFAGQLVEVKGLEHFLAAFAGVARRHSDVTAVLAGEGPLRETLLKRAGELGLEGRVRFAGGQPHGRVALWMGACDVFCLPSLREGWPNVVMEALASGRPVAATRVGGIPEVVAEGKNGALAEPADAASLEQALERVLGRSWDDAAVAASVADFSWGGAADRYLEVFRRVAGVRNEELEAV
jgi:teichuronic acid biosynthesis glycosyltransferase TuaC